MHCIGIKSEGKIIGFINIIGIAPERKGKDLCRVDNEWYVVYEPIIRLGRANTVI
jgi:hypothetical protein